MPCLPLIERELRVALRKQRPAQARLKVAALSTGVSLLFLFYGVLAGDRGVGRTLELFLCLGGLYYVLQAPLLTAGVLAEERRNQTLGLLFLSGLGAWEVFASKFLSSALIAFTNLLAIFPMLALPFLIGGVSCDLFLAIICALPVLMLFALAVSLLASVLTREDGSAVVVANVRDFTWDPQANVWLPVRSAKGVVLDRVFAKRLIDEFREIVREPLPQPSDPRFKKWDVRERFGRGHVRDKFDEQLFKSRT